MHDQQPIAEGAQKALQSRLRIQALLLLEKTIGLSQCLPSGFSTHDETVIQEVGDAPRFHAGRVLQTCRECPEIAGSKRVWLQDWLNKINEIAQSLIGYRYTIPHRST
jgi:hypothetical protein